MVVYYNTAHAAYESGIQKWKTAPERLRVFDDQYKLFVAFHAILESTAFHETGVDLDLLDSITERERSLTATLVARHADMIVKMSTKA